MLPLSEPVMILALVVLIIFVAPLLFSRFRLPGIIGLILAGAMVGPHGFNLITATDTTLFGTLGILYLMFLTGLEIDLVDFKRNRHKSLWFGLLTFSIPMVLGTSAGYYLLDFSLRTSVLLASMFASHTLLTYPIVSRLGIAKSEVVTITVGGTIITDTLALLVLAIITETAQGTPDVFFWIRLSLSIIIFMTVILVIFPIIARWLLRNLISDGYLQYTLIIALVLLAALFAQLAGLEPIIGAFLAGLALNPLIPHHSQLMNRIEFVGNTLFIPFFLVGVGLLIDLQVFVNSWETIKIAIAMTVLAILGKYLAALIMQSLAGYSANERKLIFGLSNSQAAATLAAVLIGYKLAIFSTEVLNGTIVMILISCLISALVTEKAAKKYALEQAESDQNTTDLQERILVPIANPQTVEQLIDLAVLLKSTQMHDPIYALSVILDHEDATDQILSNQKKLQNTLKHILTDKHSIQYVSRIDFNVSGGIIKAAKELLATHLIIGWNAHITTKERIFGSILDHVLAHSRLMIFVAKVVHPLNTFKKMVVTVPLYAEKEAGFMSWLTALSNLCQHTSQNIHFMGNAKTLQKIDAFYKEKRFSIESTFTHTATFQEFAEMSKIFHHDFLHIAIIARKNMLSYHAEQEEIPHALAQTTQQINFIIVYPEWPLVQSNGYVG